MSLVLTNESKAALVLYNAIETVIAEIMRYESDTFSASGVSLTSAEAMMVTAMLIKNRIRPGTNLDGASIRDSLSSIREPLN